VVVISSSQERVEAAVKRLANPNASGKAGDVRDESAFTKLLLSLAPLDHIIFSGVDIIIRGSLANADLDEAKHLFGVKFWGSVVIGKALVKHDIVKSGGSLTLTSGGAAYNPGKGAAIGGALNGGVVSLTKGLASELVDKRIRVNTVVPGLVKTELWDKLGKTQEEQEQLFKSSSEKLSVGFVATPEHIAEAYLYTARADYANGTVVIIGTFFIAHVQDFTDTCRRRRGQPVGSMCSGIKGYLRSSKYANINSNIAHRIQFLVQVQYI
jgi:NAD(P)-dependent dehydrogenase (short-subunit alcohol dehydrogenase family)